MTGLNQGFVKTGACHQCQIYLQFFPLCFPFGNQQGYPGEKSRVSFKLKGLNTFALIY
jgi:hypothetical protein